MVVEEVSGELCTHAASSQECNLHAAQCAIIVGRLAAIHAGPG